jgi:hypothetical protein
VVRPAGAVAHAALEARDGQPAERGAAPVQVVDLDLAQQPRRVVVAVHADPRQPHPGERLDPCAVEVAEADHGVDAEFLGHQRRVERRPPVGESQDAHAAHPRTPTGPRRAPSRPI